MTKRNQGKNLGSLSMKVISFVLIMLMAFSCGKVVPPGTVVIILSTDGSTNIYKNGVYKAWGRDRVYFVDGKLKSFTEPMKVLCQDKVNVSVDVKWVGAFKVEKGSINIIKEKVPSKEVSEGDISGYRLDLESFYNTAMKDIIRSISRRIISPYVTDVIPEKRAEIEKVIRSEILKELDRLKYPVHTSNILISNIDFDDSVTKQRSAIKKMQLEDQRKAAEAKATLAQAQRDEEIARERGKAKVAKAQAEAKANEILSKSITPEILAMRQWETLEELSKGKNNELIVIPYESLQSGIMNSAINRRSIRGTK